MADPVDIAFVGALLFSTVVETAPSAADFNADIELGLFVGVSSCRGLGSMHFGKDSTHLDSFALRAAPEDLARP